MFWLYHRLGLQSNVIVSAKYSCDNGRTLTKPMVVSALRTCIEKHSRLRVVGVMRPSSRKGRHVLDLATLNRIDLEQCIKWVEDPDGKGVTSDMLEMMHSEWDFQDDKPDRPFFKLFIIGGTDVVFVFHHMLCDGMSGYVFHREFLAALNAMPDTMPVPMPSTVMYTEKGTTILRDQIDVGYECVREGKPWGPQILGLALSFIFWVLAPLLLPRDRIFFSDFPRTASHIMDATARVTDAKDRTVTRVSTLRIPAEKMSKILQACRSRQTTFTPLLNTMLLTTLSADYYPKAWIGGTRFSRDLRPQLPMEKFGSVPSAGALTNLNTGGSKAHTLGKFRKVATNGGEANKLGEIRYAVDKELAWKLTREQKRHMDDTLEAHIGGMMSIDSGEDLEAFVSERMSMMGIALRYSMLISNIGPFPGPIKGTEGEWSVTDTQFSAGSVHTGQCTNGIIFDVAGIKGGDTVVNATWVDGITSRDMVEGLLAATLGRLEALAE